MSVIQRIRERMGKIELNGADQIWMYTQILKIIDEESAKGDWILCSERLPQEEESIWSLCKTVNVQLKDGTVTSGWCNRAFKEWYLLDHHSDLTIAYRYDEVLAWQPLPDSYKVGEK